MDTTKEITTPVNYELMLQINGQEPRPIIVTGDSKLTLEFDMTQVSEPFLEFNDQNGNIIKFSSRILQ